MTVGEMTNEELGTTLEERMIAEEYKIWKKNTPCELVFHLDLQMPLPVAESNVSALLFFLFGCAVSKYSY